MIEAEQMIAAMARIAQEAARVTGGRPEDIQRHMTQRLAAEEFEPVAVAQVGQAIMAQTVDQNLPPEEAVGAAFTTGVLLGAMMTRERLT